MNLSSHPESSASNSTDYERLKELSGYREFPGGKVDLQTGSFSSRPINLSEQGEIIVAPHSFSGHSFATCQDSATEQDYSQRTQLKDAIQKSLSQTGISSEEVKHIIQQVVDDSSRSDITTHDLYKMIAKTEELLAYPKKEEEEFSEDTDTLSTCSSEEDLSAKVQIKKISEDDIDSDEVWKDVPDSPEWVASQHALGAMEQVSQRLLRTVTFDPLKISSLRKEIEKQQTAIEALLQEPESLETEMIGRLGEQHDHLMIKEKMLSQYLESDPFNDKNVLRPRRIYAEAARLVFQKKEQPQVLIDPFYQWYDAEVNSYEQADRTQRSHDPTFYLDKKNPKNPLVKYNAQRVAKVLEKLAQATGASVDFTEEVERAAAVAMNRFFDWEKTEWPMIFSIGERTQAYLQLSTPLSKSETAVAADLREQGIGGIIPSVRDDGRAPINVRLTQLFRIEKGRKILLHERQQHGINDHFTIKDRYQRRQANLFSMKQLVQSGAEADDAFIRDAIKHSDQPHRLFYINLNLTTPTWTPRGNKNNEESYSRHQGTAMGASEGVQNFSVLNPENSEERADIEVNVTCIDFRFPVNYAISAVSEDPRSLDPGMVPAWRQLRAHNEEEFRKLFGGLDLYARIGGLLGSTYKKLSAQTKADINPSSEAKKLEHEIEEQVIYLREMFQTEAYKTAGEDRFKMSRHIDLLVNAFRRASELVDDHKVRVVNAGGCMSGKDREGVANAENEAAVIIQDLGGSIEPGQGGRYDDETRAIYDTCMTGVVHNTRQVTGIGGSKNAQEIANQMSDPHAKIYAQGGAGFVSA